LYIFSIKFGILPFSNSPPRIKRARWFLKSYLIGGHNVNISLQHFANKLACTRGPVLCPFLYLFCINHIAVNIKSSTSLYAKDTIVLYSKLNIPQCCIILCHWT